LPRTRLQNGKRGKPYMYLAMDQVRSRVVR
jgi:hypothetical protein